MTEDFDSFLPLSAATLHVLLALAGEDRHGYGIMQEVKRQSEGKYKLGPGTLYDNLQKMLDHGMVEDARHKSKNDDPRRRYYRLTRFGRGLLAAEASRLEGVVREVRAHLGPGLRPSPGAAS
jgi:DNA-binding PadR family transcriptional regulator